MAECIYVDDSIIEQAFSYEDNDFTIKPVIDECYVNSYESEIGFNNWCDAMLFFKFNDKQDPQSRITRERLNSLLASTGWHKHLCDGIELCINMCRKHNGDGEDRGYRNHFFCWDAAGIGSLTGDEDDNKDNLIRLNFTLNNYDEAHSLLNYLRSQTSWWNLVHRQGVYESNDPQDYVNYETFIKKFGVGRYK